MADDTRPPAGDLYSMEPDRLKQFASDLHTYAGGIRMTDDLTQAVNNFTHNPLLPGNPDVMASLGLTGLTAAAWNNGMKGTIVYRGVMVGSAADAVPQRDYEDAHNLGRLSPEARARARDEIMTRAQNDAKNAPRPSSPGTTPVPNLPNAPTA